MFGLSTGERDPWAASRGQLAERSLEQVLGAYPVDESGFWTPPDLWDADDLAAEIEEHPCVWTDGSREAYPTGGFEVVGAGVYLPAPELAMQGAVWGEVEEYGDVRLARCRPFKPVRGPLQTVQRAEFWGAFLAQQAFWPGHLGIDNVNVGRSIGRLLDRGSLAKPLPLVKDGALMAITRHMILAQGPDTVKVTKVKGHASEADVDQGRVRLEDRLGNIEADTAADLGSRHQSEEVMDVRLALLKAQENGYPIMLQLHRFMIAFSQVSVNHGGLAGSAADALVWDQAVVVSNASLILGLMLTLLCFPALLAFWMGLGFRPSGADTAAWPYSVGLLCEFSAFLGSLHWPPDTGNMGHCGSYLEILILFEQWAGHGGLLSEKVTRPHVRAHRSISISSVPVSDGIEIRQGGPFHQQSS